MSRSAIIFLVFFFPLLALLLAWLGWQSLPNNLLGWVLLGFGLLYFFGIIIVAWIRRRAFWNQQTSSNIVKEEKGDRSFWIISLGFLVFFVAPVEYLYLPHWIPNSTAMQIFGLILNLGGYLLAGWSRRLLKEAYSGHLSINETQKLVQEGPFRVIRHPAYAGFLLINLGIALGYSSLIGMIAFLVLTIPGVVVRIRVEEGLLLSQFGQAYQDYSRRTARIIPWIW